MQAFRENGHLVAATDEESLVCTDAAGFLEIFSECASENCDLFFAQSEVQQKIVEQRFPALRGKVQAVGNARVDFLSGACRSVLLDETHQLKKAYGSYILFNTNFGQVNSIWPDFKSVVSIAANAGLFDSTDPVSIAQYKAKLDWEMRNKEEITEMIRWAIANLHDKNIVLRPHPGEDVSHWKNLLGESERLRIIPRSNPLPWILGAELMIHTSCTTGLEATLMDKPVVNLVPRRHPSFSFITDFVNPVFGTWRDAADAVEEFFCTGEGRIAKGAPNKNAVLSKCFKDYEKAEASKKIASGLVQLLKQHGASFPAAGVPQIRGVGYKSVKRNETLKDKFSLTSEELATRLQSLLNEIGCGINIGLLPVEDSLFLLKPKS